VAVFRNYVWNKYRLDSQGQKLVTINMCPKLIAASVGLTSMGNVRATDLYTATLEVVPMTIPLWSLLVN